MNHQKVLIGLRNLGWMSTGLINPYFVGQSNAATIYVDDQIGISTCADYNPTLRLCGSGTKMAFATLAGAAAVALPGDEVVIREGTYDEPLIPLNSGLSETPITFRPFLNETVILTGSHSPATIQLTDVSYLTIEGLVLEDTRWIEARNSHHIRILNNTFLRTPASGTTGNVRFISSDHNTISNNALHDGNDNLLLIDSDFNLVEGNTITEGRHSLLSIRCSNYNLIRGNFFSNEQQKIAEVYDCGVDTSAVPHAFDATKHNVIEHNVFAQASSYYATTGGSGIQYAGQDGIIRFNVFFHANAGLSMQTYGDEALFNHRNRTYHNVFYDNDCAGIAVHDDLIDHVFKNNILFHNKGISGDCFGTGTAQLVYRGPLQEIYFERNNIIHLIPSEAVIQEEFGSANTLSHYESTYPTVFFSNLELDPGFVNPGNFDFHLMGDSALIDAGAFLSHTVDAGSGILVSLDDARFFHNGFGIDSVSGDWIQFEGQANLFRVVAVDYETHMITLDKPFSWPANIGIALVYVGDRPDVGAFEFFDHPLWETWRRDDRQFCGTQSPSILVFVQYLSNNGCSSDGIGPSLATELLPAEF